MPEYILTYGTLRNGEIMCEKFLWGLRFIETVTVRGALYNLGSYPGFKRDDLMDVVCDKFEITDPRVLAQLDIYEGYSKSDLSSSLYIREPLVPDCWIYVFNHKVFEADLITNGDWKNRYEKNSPN